MPLKIGGASGRPGGYRAGSGRRETPTFTKTKSISYGTSDQIYSASSTVSASAESASIPSKIDIQNAGVVPLSILAGYETYSDETTDVGATRYLHIMLMPGETYNPPVRAVISTEGASTQFDGTAVENKAITDDGLESGTKILYTDSTADVDHATSATMGSDATHTTLNLEDGHSKFFRVGDLIRLENEICEVTATGTGANLANSTLTITRGAYGSTAATHADDVAVRLPFFNAYHDFDQYSVAQTDSNGSFKCHNFFGLGRASSGRQGIVPGSVAIKFYKPGYQELGLSGITSSTNSGLTASGSYWLKIAIDGGTAESINFTTDSSNVNFGGTNGVISKIQDALDAKYYNTAANIFEQKATIGIVNGDIRFTSGQRLSTSAIALTAGVDGASASYNIFAQQNGRFKALANIDAAVAAKLPDDVIYDRITFEQSPLNVFGYDDGYGRMQGMCSGTINYETGAVDMTGCPVNAEFVYSVSHTSAFSGKLNTGDNALVSVLANCPSQKRNGSVIVRTY